MVIFMLDLCDSIGTGASVSWSDYFPFPRMSRLRCCLGGVLFLSLPLLFQLAISILLFYVLFPCIHSHVIYTYIPTYLHSGPLLSYDVFLSDFSHFFQRSIPRTRTTFLWQQGLNRAPRTDYIVWSHCLSQTYPGVYIGGKSSHMRHSAFYRLCYFSLAPFVYSHFSRYLLITYPVYSLILSSLCLLDAVYFYRFWFWMLFSLLGCRSRTSWSIGSRFVRVFFDLFRRGSCRYRDMIEWKKKSWSARNA